MIDPRDFDETTLDRILDQIETLIDYEVTLNEIRDLPEVPSCEPWRWER